MSRRFDILLTAQEAFPALEQEFLNAQHEILASFRIFDPTTKLRSKTAKQVGETWSDLITDTLNRNVKITLTISDFDPVVRADNHIYTWECLGEIDAAGQRSHQPELLNATAVMHPARVGLLPRLLLWPRLLKELRENLAPINKKTVKEKKQFLQAAPALAPLVKWQGESIVPRSFPPPPLVPVSHHQKLAVFDNKQLYIGGLDLNDRRYDTPEHEQAAEDTWHDVQLIIDGNAAQEAAEHLKHYQTVTAGAQPKSTKHILRTISSRRKFAFAHMSPKKCVEELAEAHGSQIQKSETLIYLESQFFRDRRLAQQLANRAQQAPGLCMILILPVAPEDAAFGDEAGSDVAYGEYLQTKSIEIVQKAFGARLFIGSPLQPRVATEDSRATAHGAPLIYLHAKISIFDDRCAIVSSANLNGRSLGWDTEAGIRTETEQEVAELRQRCFSHWLGPNADPACFESKTACDSWAALAARNAQTHPTGRQGFILPHSTADAASSGYNLPGVPDEMV